MYINIQFLTELILLIIIYKSVLVNWYIYNQHKKKAFFSFFFYNDISKDQWILLTVALCFNEHCTW